MNYDNLKIQGKSCENVSLGMQEYVVSTFSQGNCLSENAPSIITSPANSRDTFQEFPNLNSEFEVVSDTDDLDQLGANLEETSMWSTPTIVPFITKPEPRG